MVKREDKIKEYALEHPDQLYVNQKNILSISGHETSDVGYAFIRELKESFSENNGQYTFHQTYIKEYVDVLYNYHHKQVKNVEDEIQAEISEVVEIVTNETNEFVTLQMAMPFVADTDENALLERLRQNILDEDVVELLHRDDRQIIGGRIVPK